MAVSGNVVSIRVLRGNGGLAVLSVIRVCGSNVEMWIFQLLIFRLLRNL